MRYVLFGSEYIDYLRRLVIGSCYYSWSVKLKKLASDIRPVGLIDYI